MALLRVAVVVLGLAAAAQGALHDGGLGAARREAISKGSAVPGQYLARVTASSSGECEQRRQSILALKAKMTGPLASKAVERSAVRRIGYLCLVSFDGDELVASAVRKLSYVQYVKQNMEVMALADPPSWGLNRIDQASLPLSSGKAFSVSHTGSGVQIYVIDTGVLASHSQFGGRASYAADFVNEGAQADQNGHGTHCAGTAGGSTYGVASTATINGVKVLSGQGSGTFDGVIAGIQFAVDNQRTRFGGAAAVLSMSLGGGYYQPVIDAVNAAASAGHIVAVAAGNSANDACTLSPAGAGGRGASGGVITVGATDRYDSMAYYSSYGSCVDILAPGTDISSAWIGSNSATNTISGTSMATPHVAGVAAALLAKHNGNKAAAVAELFASAALNKISGVSGSPNKLLQAPQGTASPTKQPTAAAPTAPTTSSPTSAPSAPSAQPTLEPTTRAPTPKPTAPTTVPTAPQVCVGQDCFEYGLSLFGPQAFPARPVAGLVAVAPNSNVLACSPFDESYAGKVLIVTRGTCTFQTKVRNAENAGAVAVIIVMATSELIFRPAPDGSADVGIMSALISLSDGNKARGHTSPVLGVFGDASAVTTDAPTAPTAPTGQPTSSPTVVTEAPTDSPTVVTDPPTPEPSESPTPAPTKRRRTKSPTKSPTPQPTQAPTAPTPSPTRRTKRPTPFPTAPTASPTRRTRAPRPP
jgi:subtilisin family serine protease